MSEKRLEWKVGLFVFAGLLVLAGLMINFTKGVAFFRPTYELRLRTDNVGGIKPKAAVLLAGVPVGVVESIELSEDSKSVVMIVEVFRRYRIHGDAVFTIESAGFLGDQYIAVTPTANAVPELQGGDERECRASFNLQDAARSAVGLVQRIEQLVGKVDTAVERINASVLAPPTLASISNVVINLNAASVGATDMIRQVTALGGQGEQTLQQVNGFLATNSAAFHEVVTNLLRFTDKMSSVGDKLEALVATNHGNINGTLTHVRALTRQATNLLHSLLEGQGVAGTLLRDGQLAADLRDAAARLPLLSSNLNSAATNANLLLGGANEALGDLRQMLHQGGLAMSNGAVLVSNLNRHGLFYKPKAPRDSNPDLLPPPRQRNLFKP